MIELGAGKCTGVSTARFKDLANRNVNVAFFINEYTYVHVRTYKDTGPKLGLGKRIFVSFDL